MASQLSRQGSVREMVHASLVPPDLLREDLAVSVQADCIKRGRCLKMCVGNEWKEVCGRESE